MNIGISGFPPDTSEADIREALEKYGAIINKITIQPSKREDGYLANVDVDTDETGCKVLVEKINGVFWKGRKLRAHSYLFLKQ
ncbi:MAG: RNA-binding protein, partial [Pseudomonadota bacterium]|nr:RNA-binding protein [Pseudomonadota bacterium]